MDLKDDLARIFNFLFYELYLDSEWNKDNLWPLTIFAQIGLESDILERIFMLPRTDKGGLLQTWKNAIEQTADNSVAKETLWHISRTFWFCNFTSNKNVHFEIALYSILSVEPARKELTSFSGLRQAVRKKIVQKPIVLDILLSNWNNYSEEITNGEFASALLDIGFVAEINNLYSNAYDFLNITVKFCVFIYLTRQIKKSNIGDSKWPETAFLVLQNSAQDKIMKPIINDNNENILKKWLQTLLALKGGLEIREPDLYTIKRDPSSLNYLFYDKEGKYLLQKVW